MDNKKVPVPLVAVTSNDQACFLTCLIFTEYCLELPLKGGAMGLEWKRNSYTNLCGSVVWSLSHVQLFVAPWTAARQASLPFTVSQSLLRPISTESMMTSTHLILCHPLLLMSSVFPSIRVSSNELALSIRWAKYWSFSISPSSEYSGLISFRVEWFDLCQESSLAPQCRIQIHQFFFMVQLSNPYVTTGETIALTVWIFVGKVTSLLFNSVSVCHSFPSKDQVS